MKKNMCPFWRIYGLGKKLPKMFFSNGMMIDLSNDDIVLKIEKLLPNEMLMFYQHKPLGTSVPYGYKVQYLFGRSFTVSKVYDDSICVFGNGCLFEE